MKKQISFLVIMLSTLPFAIQKLKGPFYDINTDYSNYSNNNITLVTKENLNKKLFEHTDLEFGEYPHLYMYDETSECSIVYANDTVTQLFEAANYFLCKFNYAIQFPHFYIVRKKLSTFSNFYDIRNITEIVKNVCSTLPKECILPNGPFDMIDQPGITNTQLAKNLEVELSKDKDVRLIVLDKSELKTKSGITISHLQSKVSINKETKTENFQIMLAKYIDDKIKNAASSTPTSASVPAVPSTSSSTSMPSVPKINQSNLDLLNKSTIVAVYGLMNNQSDNESIIWGLAIDKNTKEVFHWMIDLEEDISVLLPDSP